MVAASPFSCAESSGKFDPARSVIFMNCTSHIDMNQQRRASFQTRKGRRNTLNAAWYGP
jgi:hypothetical protein